MSHLRISNYFVAVIFPFLLVACAEKTAPDPRNEAPLVRTATVQEGKPSSVSFTGVVTARVQSDLGVRVTGKVLERLVDVGQSVKRGQPLLRIDPVDLKLSLKAQQEAVVAARARAIQAAEDEARYRDLRGTGAISASTYDQIKAAADSAQALMRAAEAQADVAKNSSNYSEIVAETDGVIVETLVEPGQIVSPGQVVIRLAHSGHREALIQLPETIRPKLGSEAEARLFGNNEIPVAAKLRQLANSADRVTRTFEARYVLEGDLSNAPLGSTITIRIKDKPSQDTSSWYVPLGAVFDPGNGTGIWVVNQETVSWRPVKVIRLDDAGAYVDAKLVKGERIVTLGAHLLREGQKIRLAVLSNTTGTKGEPQ